jgi:hypothetical protein
VPSGVNDEIVLPCASVRRNKIINSHSDDSLWRSSTFRRTAGRVREERRGRQSQLFWFWNHDVHTADREGERGSVSEERGRIILSVNTFLSSRRQSWKVLVAMALHLFALERGEG